jgi:thiol:disulfide interchange protein
VVAGLALLMLLVALNMSGVFEVGASVQGVASGASGPGRDRAFLTGALAVVVAAPCTAPFMAGALGYALTQPPLVSLAVFLALALGFAAPFVLLAFIPGLLARLPRPGSVDGRAEEGPGLPDVRHGRCGWPGCSASRPGRSPWPPCWPPASWSPSPPGSTAWRRRGASGKGAALVPFVLAALSLAAAVALVGGRRPRRARRLGLASRRAPSSAGPGLAAEPWSPEKVKALQAEGKVVMVDFTADWCVTCKVNEGRL